MTVLDDPEQQRFEARTRDGEVAGFAAYQHRGDVVVFTHTEVADAYEGSGVGSVLVRSALDLVRAEGRSVRPDCPFVRGWIERHRDYADLLATG